MPPAAAAEIPLIGKGDELTFPAAIDVEREGSGFIETDGVYFVILTPGFWILEYSQSI